MPPPPNALLLEDELLIAMDNEDALRKRGFDVCATDKAEQALQMIERALREGKPIDLISVDNNLQGEMRGYDLVRRIRSDSALSAVRNVPVLAYSSDQLPAELAQGGNLVYLPKGLTTQEQYGDTALRLVKNTRQQTHDR